MWGLGFKYRVKGDATQDSVMRFANYFREKQIPCDVLGLEPGWQTATYSCSYRWSDDRFPRHKESAGPVAAERIQSKPVGTRVCSSFFPHPEGAGALLRRFPCMERTGTGLHPAGSTQNIYRLPPHTDRRSISGFKLDECDNSNISFASATWCFPDMAQFPSGIDGEKMHQVFGSLYVNAMDECTLWDRMYHYKVRRCVKT